MTTDATSSSRQRPRWRHPAALTAMLLVVLLIGLLANPIGQRFLRNPLGQPAEVGTSTVVLQDSWFSPPVVRVPVDTTVTFVWNDGGDLHDVAFDDGVASEVIGSGTFERTFTEPGDYPYVCTLHAFMIGRVEVTE
jgi:plastocyanin